MYNPKLELLANKLRAAIAQCVMEFHEQVKGVRVIGLSIDSEVLHPEGIKYIIRSEVQITIDKTKKEKE